MAKYKIYENNNFNISDGAIVIDNVSDLGSKNTVHIEVIKGKLLVELEYEPLVNGGDNWEQQFPMYVSKMQSFPRVRKFRINSAMDGTHYLIKTGIDVEMLNTGNSMVIIDKNTQKPANVESNGALAVNIQDQTSDAVDLYLFQELGTFTLSANTTVGNKIISVNGGHNIQVEELLHFSEGNNFSQFTVLAVNVNNITLDSPIDKVYTTATTYHNGTKNLAVDGSITPAIFNLSPPTNLQWDITRINIVITDNLDMDFQKFGGDSTLINGCVFRSKLNNVFKNYFNVKSNGDILNQGGIHNFQSKSGLGSYGFNCLIDFAGQNKRGIVIRLDGSTNDEIQCIIQDDLTDLISFSLVIQGHVVID